MKQSFLNNEALIVVCLFLSVLRIYLEVIGFNFNQLPLTKKFQMNQTKFHRYGFYISVGYFILFAPGYLLS